MINTLSEGENSPEIFQWSLPSAPVKVINMSQSCGNIQLSSPNKPHFSEVNPEVHFLYWVQDQSVSSHSFLTM